MLQNLNQVMLMSQFKSSSNELDKAKVAVNLSTKRKQGESAPVQIPKLNGLRKGKKLCLPKQNKLMLNFEGEAKPTSSLRSSKPKCSSTWLQRVGSPIVKLSGLVWA
jgi:hypothetical protein